MVHRAARLLPHLLALVVETKTLSEGKGPKSLGHLAAIGKNLTETAESLDKLAD